MRQQVRLGGDLHTMAVLQAYQADLLRDLDQGQGLSDLALQEKNFLLDAPVSPSELFGPTVEMVVEKF